MFHDPASDANDPGESAPPKLPADHSPAPAASPVVRLEPGLGSSLALTAIYVVGLVGVQTVASIVEMIRRHPLGLGPWTTVLTMVLAFTGTMALVPALGRCSLRTVLHPRLQPMAALPAILLLAVGGWLIAGEIGVLTERAMPMPPFIATMFEELFSTADPVGSLVLLVAVPPLVEETLCRGLVLRSMLGRWTPATSIMASALVFGLIHLNPWQFFYATWLGVVFGWAYCRTRSLGLCMLMHAVNNGLSWVLMRFQPDWAGLERKSFSEPPEHLPVLLLLAGFGLLVAGAALLLRLPLPKSKPVTLGPDSSPALPG